ncbi:hypothetical protein T459_26731 [Capsicum annuum]|uniref:Ubiquitin-like protease family profile domain-containing protein n=1 Tax=Capsicum annuum TaxID=4072 RepID=A0A2G2YBZ2_CAPAN|nr:hypothetical protein T459_26731 [Capsicum annuum]
MALPSKCQDEFLIELMVMIVKKLIVVATFTGLENEDQVYYEDILVFCNCNIDIGKEEERSWTIYVADRPMACYESMLFHDGVLYTIVSYWDDQEFQNDVDFDNRIGEEINHVVVLKAGCCEIKLYLCRKIAIPSQFLPEVEMDVKQKNGIATVETSDVIDETYDATDENLCNGLKIWCNYENLMQQAWAFEAIPYLRQQEMTSKRGFIPSKRISYPEMPLEIKAAMRRRKDTSKASSIIIKSKIETPLSLYCTDVQCARATEEQHELKKLLSKSDNSSTASRDEEKMEPVSLRERKNYPFEGFNISDEALKKLIQLTNDYSEWIADGLLKHHAGRYYQQQPKVSQNEERLINIIKDLRIPTGLPWHLVDEVYIPINCGDEFHWVLVVVVLKERRILVYDLMSRRRHLGLSSEIQKMAKILPTYLDMSGFLNQKVRTDWSTIKAYQDKMANPFDVQYVDGIAQQTIGSLDCGPFVVAYAEYLTDGLQLPNDGLDARLLHKRYVALL